MKIVFTVIATIDKIEKQPTTEFVKEDGTAMVKYLSEKIEKAIADTWQYNAKVTTVKITRKRLSYIKNTKQ